MVAQKIVFVACLFISALCFVTADEEAEVGIVIVKVLGRSGKISVRQKSQNETSAIIITMESLEELDSNNKTVGNGGKRKHTFRNFANQDFVFSSARNSTYQKLKVLTFSSKGYLVGPDANFTVFYYIFQENGTIDVGDNETANVYVGTLKWTIQIENWQFCGGPNGDNCTRGGKKEVGEKLSFTISVKSRKPPKKRARPSTKDPKGKRKLEEYDIGDASLELSKQVKTDGAWSAMENGFPLYESGRNKQQFTFRFPKFANTTFYDPNMSIGSPTSGGESGDTTPTSTTQGSTASHTYPLSYAFLAIAMVLGAFTDMFY